MLMPKRTKYRKAFRGNMRGKASRGNVLAYGTYGLVATEQLDKIKSDRSSPCSNDTLHKKRWTGVDKNIPR